MNMVQTLSSALNDSIVDYHENYLLGVKKRRTANRGATHCKDCPERILQKFKIGIFILFVGIFSLVISFLLSSPISTAISAWILVIGQVIFTKSLIERGKTFG